MAWLGRVFIMAWLGRLDQLHWSTIMNMWVKCQKCLKLHLHVFSFHTNNLIAQLQNKATHIIKYANP